MYIFLKYNNNNNNNNNININNNKKKNNLLQETMNFNQTERGKRKTKCKSQISRQYE